MFDVGRVCVKIAGRDAGKKCVIIDTPGYPFVLIDGETRRRKTNVNHLVPLAQTVDVKQGAGHDELGDVLKSVSITLRNTKPKQAKPRPRVVRKAKPKVKKVVKKEVEAKVVEKKEETSPAKEAPTTPPPSPSKPVSKPE